MITGADFLMFSTGIGVIVVSISAAVRILTSGPSRTKAPPVPVSKWEPIPDPASDGLNDRLRAFQDARFASPIVQRKLDADAVPQIRSNRPRPGSGRTEK